MNQSATAHIVFGPQGAGKTTYARNLSDSVGAVRFSIDEWMIQLFGPDLPNSMSLPWIMARVERCEKRIWSVASQICSLGGSVVLDLGFMQVSDRKRFIGLAHESGLLSQLHFVNAPYSVRRNRVLARNNERGDTFAFEVTPEMFDFMDQRFEFPADWELTSAMQASSEA